ncbi:MAG: alpha/beta hydrolase [Gammaproteobacteria bacterium]|nr:alpha/beta hydrolase [Gammaproteobacteria bacterium]
MVPSNGITLGVFCAGPETGPAVVLCHGFPELAYSWRFQIPALAAAGYRVLAPDMRGFGHSDRPASVSDYGLQDLCLDVTGVLDHFGITQSVVVGHDWGGAVAWALPLRHPDRVRGVAGINTPFTPRNPRYRPMESFARKFGDEMYIVQFQTPGVADELFARDCTATMRFFMRRSRYSAEQFAHAPKAVRSLNLLRALEQGNADLWASESVVSDEAIAVFARAFERTGFTGGINWYRNMDRNWETSADLPQHISQPALMIMAENDVVLPPSAADGMETYVPNLTRHLVKNCGHWTQQEHPDEVNRVLLDWLATLN